MEIFCPRIRYEYHNAPDVAVNRKFEPTNVDDNDIYRVMSNK